MKIWLENWLQTTCGKPSKRSYPRAAKTPRRKTAHRRSGDFNGHRLRAKERHSLGDAAPRDGLRIGDVTCWRRLREWQEAGVWERLHRVLLDRLGEADQIDWERASLDSASIPAKRGAPKPARIRRIKERRAPSATLFRTERGSHWP